MLLLVGICIAALIWRISSSPLDIGFARDYIEKSLRSDEREHYAKIERMMLHWPDFRGPLLLGLGSVSIVDAQENALISVDEAALSLSKTHLLAGRISLEGLILKKPHLKMTRAQDGALDIGFGDISTMEEPHKHEQQDLTTRLLAYIAEPGQQNIKAEDTPLATLQSFKIENATVMVEDHVMDMSWSLPDVNANIQSTPDGLKATLYAQLPEIYSADAYVNAALDMDWETRRSDVKADIRNFDAQILASKIPEIAQMGIQNVNFDTSVQLSLDENFMPLKGRIQFASKTGSLMIPDFSDEPVTYSDLWLEGEYDQATQHIALREASITARDVTLKASGEFDLGAQNISGPLHLEINDLKHEQIAPLWPKTLRSENAHLWLVDRMRDGVFSKVETNMNIQAMRGDDQTWDVEAQNITARFDFENMTIDYRSPLPAVIEAAGSASLDNDNELIEATITSAKVNDIAIENAKFSFDNIHQKGQSTADITLKMNGTINDIFRYTAYEPIHFSSPFSLEETKGQAAFDVHLNFPATSSVRAEEIKITVNGQLSDALLPDVVKDMDLTGGPFAFEIKDGAFNTVGKGQLGGHPIKASYTTFLDSKGKPYRAQTTASLKMDEALRQTFNIDLSDFLSGSADLNLTYTENHDEKNTAEMALDLTQTTVSILPFGYEKKPGIKGSAQITAHLEHGDVSTIKIAKIDAPDLMLRGGDLHFKNGKNGRDLSHGTLSSLNIGQTQGRLEFEYEASGRLRLALDGDTIDLRPFLNDNEDQDKQDTGTAILLSANAARMITHQNEAITKGKIYADIDAQGRFNQLEMDAIAGAGAIYLRYKPDETGQRNFRLEADDAGAMLKAFGVYSKIRGGKLIIYGEPIRGIYDRNLVGKAEITDFKVVKAPGLARLLGAMSLPGLNQLLGGEGLNFTKLEADFDWLYRPRGSVLVLKEGRTSGNSLGLTFDGTFDKANNKVNVNGTIVPISGINKMVSNIPIIGNLLSGGSDAVFAATYDIKGTTDDPQISVNPLSVLAPGILRRILFE